MASSPILPLPRTLALVDDDAEYSEYLAQHLEALGVDVHHFADSNDLLTEDQPFGYGFYIVDLMLPGVDGVDLIGLLRRRTQAGILVVSGRAAPDVFARVIDVGADMYLAKPVSFEQVVVAVRGVHRRVSARRRRSAWVLEARASRLVAPDGALISLSETDLAVMQCFLDAARRNRHPRSAVPAPGPRRNARGGEPAQRHRVPAASEGGARHAAAGPAADAGASGLHLSRCAGRGLIGSFASIPSVSPFAAPIGHVLWQLQPEDRAAARIGALVHAGHRATPSRGAPRTGRGRGRGLSGCRAHRVQTGVRRVQARCPGPGPSLPGPVTAVLPGRSRAAPPGASGRE
jgi:two-component system OmpR family response regulator